jgi:asparagine synthase (glutamine-hydrolysing)
MCGFVALLSLTGQKPDVNRVAQMTEVLAHRGPDDRGQFSEHAISLGFRRLAILDPAPSGHQPMLSADGRHVIVFNGAIFNFIELRAELEAFGHIFRSTGDTEVLLAAYKQWGRDCLPRLNGMWAFIVYDRVERRLFGARDRFGVKPLFWHRDARSLIFASEIKAIRDPRAGSLDFNQGVIEEYMFEGALDTGDETFYRGVRHVPAGTAFECDAYGNLSWQKYWSLDSAVNELATPSDPAAAYAELFDDAIHLRMRSDVPVGVQLSGGLDSTSIIAGVAQEMKLHPQPGQQLSAFCYLDPQFDESEFIQPTLTQTRAQLEILNANPMSMWNALGEHLWYHDEPVQSFSSVAGYQLMALARSKGVKVLLNGQGADEVLGGYPNYFKHYWAELIRNGSVLKLGRAIRDTAALSGWPSAYSLGAAAFDMSLRQVLRRIPGGRALAESRQKRAVKDDAWISDQVKQQRRASLKDYPNSLNEELRMSLERTPLPLYLRVEDRNAMAHGIETRVPFLDHRLVTLAFRLGSEWKLNGVYSKWLLRLAMRNRIPEVVRLRVPKFGFPTGMDRWFRAELYEPLRDTIASRAIRESGLWNLPQIERDLESHRRGDINVGERLFDVAQLGLILQGLPAPSRQQRVVGSSLS